MAVVKVKFVNNEEIIIHSDTYLFAWNSLDSNNGTEEFYAEGGSVGSRNDGGLLGTSEPVIALQGLFGTHDWFSLHDDPTKIYKTSAILSLETITIQ
ncbi:hypothetical protein EFM21_06230 [Leuconostoc falkenbergense]|uniref:hypothetical protein n=1 Tax=Leuconostoc falkenbergense TaxID=2766470 RepID=UPI0021A9B989|nr:hypothetical protein [Leuconostoc falkenbergense]MCT4378754.1 hypothetical protein [Leuconostoc falkenbergense]